MKGYLSQLGSGARTGLIFFLGVWIFVGLMVLVFGMYTKTVMVFGLARLVGVGLFLYLILKVFKQLGWAARVLTALVIWGVFLFLNAFFIDYAVVVNQRTIINCGKDAHELFWSPFSSNCKRGFWYNINPFDILKVSPGTRPDVRSNDGLTG